MTGAILHLQQLMTFAPPQITCENDPWTFNAWRQAKMRLGHRRYNGALESIPPLLRIFTHGKCQQMQYSSFLPEKIRWGKRPSKEGEY